MGYPSGLFSLSVLASRAPPVFVFCFLHFAEKGNSDAYMRLCFLVHFSLPIAVVLLLSWRIEILLVRLRLSERDWLLTWVGLLCQSQRLFNFSYGAQKRT